MAAIERIRKAVQKKRSSETRSTVCMTYHD
jgi:hypothetical protein